MANSRGDTSKLWQVLAGSELGLKGSIEYVRELNAKYALWFELCQHGGSLVLFRFIFDINVKLNVFESLGLLVFFLHVGCDEGNFYGPQ